MPRKLPPPQPENLTASIERTEQSYFISEHREHGFVDDEAILTVIGRIEEISPRHKRFFGQRIEMSFVCSRRFGKDDGEAVGKPFLLDMNLRKERCSFMAYLPADAFWALPPMIASKTVTHIEASFEPTRHGSASLLSVYFSRPENG